MLHFASAAKWSKFSAMPQYRTPAYTIWRFRSRSLTAFMDQEVVVPYFQLLVTFPEQKTIGYEVLGRSNLYGLKTP